MSITVGTKVFTPDGGGEVISVYGDWYSVALDRGGYFRGSERDVKDQNAPVLVDHRKSVSLKVMRQNLPMRK